MNIFFINLLESFKYMYICFKVRSTLNNLNFMVLNFLKYLKKILLLNFIINEFNMNSNISILSLCVIHFFSISLPDYTKINIILKFIIRKYYKLSIHKSIILLPRLISSCLNLDSETTKIIG